MDDPLDVILKEYYHYDKIIKKDKNIKDEYILDKENMIGNVIEDLRSSIFDINLDDSIDKCFEDVEISDIGYCDDSNKIDFSKFFINGEKYQTIVSPHGFRDIKSGSRNHKGFDFKTIDKTKINAPIDAYILEKNTSDNSRAGKYLSIGINVKDNDIGNDVDFIIVRYMHLDSITTKAVGVKIPTGGYLCSTGNSNGGTGGTYHLHMEVYVFNKEKDDIVKNIKSIDDINMSKFKLSKDKYNTIPTSVFDFDTMKLEKGTASINNIKNWYGKEYNTKDCLPLLVKDISDQLVCGPTGV